VSKTFLIVDGDLNLDEGGRGTLIGQDPDNLDDVQLPPGVEAQPGTEGEVSAQIKASQDLGEAIGTGYVPSEGYGNKALDRIGHTGRSPQAARTTIGQEVQEAVTRLMDLQHEELSKMTPGELIDYIDEIVVLPGQNRKTDVTFYARCITESKAAVRRAYLTRMGHQG